MDFDLYLLLTCSPQRTYYSWSFIKCGAWINQRRNQCCNAKESDRIRVWWKGKKETIPSPEAYSVARQIVPIKLRLAPRTDSTKLKAGKYVYPTQEIPYRALTTYRIFGNSQSPSENEIPSRKKKHNEVLLIPPRSRARNRAMHWIKKRINAIWQRLLKVLIAQRTEHR